MQSERSNRANLLAVALAGFGKVGFEATSLEGIAKAAEVPPAEALLLFPTRALRW
jgi:AcrR family transcriptional regulator